jgi:hypothetical protein
MFEITALCLEQKCATANNIADLDDIMAMGRYWVDNNKTSDDQQVDVAGRRLSFDTL